ncbi:MAG TPA: putative Ig domain-containing protein [Acidimicrobiales bacterium]|nr:putative Ig domain-containing protein [Acidimicrobiales bacterium]
MLRRLRNTARRSTVVLTVGLAAAFACSATLDATAAASATVWTAPSSLGAIGGVDAVSCTSSAFCMVGGSGGNFETWNGTSWSAPTTLPGGVSITALSCATSSDCIAGDSSGNVWVTGDAGATWTTSSVSSYEITSESCVPSGAYCMAVDADGDAFVYSGDFWWMAGWTSDSRIDGAVPIASVSCASSSFCVLLDSAGNYSVFDGSTFSSFSGLASHFADGAEVSCPSSTFCAAVDGEGDGYSYNGTTWTGPSVLDASSAGEGVSCASSAICYAVSSSGNAYPDAAASWGSAIEVSTASLSGGISCVSSSWCMAVDANGDYVEGPGPFFTTSSLPPAGFGTAYSAAVTATLDAPYSSWSATGLPHGLSISSGSGVISGTPSSAPGSFSAVVTVTGANSGTATATLPLTLAQGSQSLSFTSTAPGAATIGGTSYTPRASATSALTATITVDSSSSAVCSISSGVVHFIGRGTCQLDANQAGNTDWAAAPQASQSFDVGGGTSQSASFTSTAPAGATAGGATYTPTATATSGLAPTITVDSTSSMVCSISGGVVSFIAAGTCVLDANQAGSATYLPAVQVQQDIGVAPLPAPASSGSGAAAGGSSAAETTSTTTSTSMPVAPTVSTPAPTTTTTTTAARPSSASALAVSPTPLPYASWTTSRSRRATSPSTPAGSQAASKAVVPVIVHCDATSCRGTVALIVARQGAHHVDHIVLAAQHIDLARTPKSGALVRLHLTRSGEEWLVPRVRKATRLDGKFQITLTVQVNGLPAAKERAYLKS